MISFLKKWSHNTHSSTTELIKLQTVKQSADKLCTPNRYQPPPTRNNSRDSE